jgi:hypothetical protein
MKHDWSCMKRFSFVLLLIALLHNFVFAQGVLSVQPSTLRHFSPTEDAPEAWALDSAKNLLYVGAKNQISVFRLDTGEITNKYAISCPYNYEKIQRIESHGSVLLVQCQARQIYPLKHIVIDLMTDKIIRDNSTSDLVAISDNLEVEATYESGIISVKHGNKINEIKSNNSVKKIKLSNDGNFLTVQSSTTIDIWDVKSDAKKISTLSASSYDEYGLISDTQLSPDNKTLVIIADDGMLVYSLPKFLVFKQKISTDFRYDLINLQFLNDEGGSIFLSSMLRSDVSYVFNLITGKVLQSFDTQAAGFSDNGRYFVTLSGNQFSVVGNDALNVWLRGTVEVLVNTNIPEARVSINGIDRGSANDVGGELKLYPGDYDLTVSAPGFQAQSQRFTVEAGKPISLNLPLEKIRGVLYLTSEPSGATVTLDGKKLGVTPLTITDLDLGTHQYSLNLDDYFQMNGTVTLTDENQQTILADLKEMPGLVFNSIPVGATISIDGNSVGKTPITVRNLTPGQINFTATLEGYQSFTGRAIVPTNGKGKVSIKLLSIAQLRKPWEMALERTIVLDNAPAFAVRDLLTFIKGLTYKPESLALFMNGKLLSRAFQPSPGVKGSLVIYKGSAYLPSGLLPLIEIGSRYVSPILTLTLSGNTSLDFRFNPTGRNVTTTTAIIKARNDAAQAAKAQQKAAEARQKADNARLERLQAQELALQEGIAKILRNRYPSSPDFIYLGNNKWGSAGWINTDPPYSIITIVIASNTNVKMWKTCTFISEPGWTVGDVNSSDGYLVVQVQRNYSQKIVYFDYADRKCQLVSQN